MTMYEIRRPGMCRWGMCCSIDEARSERRHADSMAGRGHRVYRVDHDGTRVDVTYEDVADCD
jgi:hypothetical protein